MFSECLLTNIHCMRIQLQCTTRRARNVGQIAECEGIGHAPLPHLSIMNKAADCLKLNDAAARNRVQCSHSIQQMLCNYAKHAGLGP